MEVIKGIKIGPKVMVDDKDNKQIQQTNRRHSKSFKETRMARRNERAAQNKFFLKEELTMRLE